MSIAFNTVKRQANVRSLRALTATSQIQTRSFTFTPSTAFISTRPTKMASILSSAASAAHSAVASLASVAQAKPGDSVPSAEAKINDLEDKINFSTLKGKNILVTVPGAFSPTCSSQVPGYLERFDDFKAKGVEGIYVVTVNDIFVVNAWKEKINKDASSTKDVKYVADDTGAVASAFGLVLDAQAIFGGPRLKRAAVVIDNGKVVSVAVEPSPGEVTVSHADEVIKNL